MRIRVAWRVCVSVWPGGYAYPGGLSGMRIRVGWRVCVSVWAGGYAYPCGLVGMRIRVATRSELTHHRFWAGAERDQARLCSGQFALDFSDRR